MRHIFVIAWICCVWNIYDVTAQQFPLSTTHREHAFLLNPASPVLNLLLEVITERISMTKS